MIFNKTKNKIISEHELICKNIFAQSFGLMFRRKQNLVMILDKERRVSLHMFFVFFPIDVLIVDENKKIVEIKSNLKPFTFWNSEQKGKYVLEMIQKGDYKEGDKLELS